MMYIKADWDDPARNMPNYYFRRYFVTVLSTFAANNDQQYSEMRKILALVFAIPFLSTKHFQISQVSLITFCQRAPGLQQGQMFRKRSLCVRTLKLMGAYLESMRTYVDGWHKVKAIGHQR